MPRYFFNLHDGQPHPDEVGTELDNLDEAQRCAMRYAADFMRDNPDAFWDGREWILETTDEVGLVLFVIHIQVMLSPAISGGPPR